MVEKLVVIETRSRKQERHPRAARASEQQWQRPRAAARREGVRALREHLFEYGLEIWMGGSAADQSAFVGGAYRFLWGGWLLVDGEVPSCSQQICPSAAQYAKVGAQGAEVTQVSLYSRGGLIAANCGVHGADVVLFW